MNGVAHQNFRMIQGGVWKIHFTVVGTAKWLWRTSILDQYPPDGPAHVIFCMVDHYEPGHGNVDQQTQMSRVENLHSVYPNLADRHRDSKGRPLQRTWFFPPHDHRYGNLRRLVSLCSQGYGEIELHLHHGKLAPDTSENLERLLRQCILEYSSFGIFGSADGHLRYGFIHGDWALDNAHKGRFCGVNNELQILQKTGCYADFTFPSPNRANPSMVNTIFYADDDPARPKSYRRGTPVRQGRENNGLMLIQGPLHPCRIKPGLLGGRLVGDAIDSDAPASEGRVDGWVKTNIHVTGRPNWIIIKTHTHGAVDAAAVLGPKMDRICSVLETKYNDGKNFILHYVTARELYNIIKAAEAGVTGENPADYRDYFIQGPAYDSSPEIPQASDQLKSLISMTYPLD